MAEQQLDPTPTANRIRFWPSKVLLSAVEMNVFTVLRDRN
jgi:hypothetical protein